MPTTDYPLPITGMWRITRPWLLWTAVLLLAVAAAFPLLAEPGLLNTRGGGDSPFLLQRVQQLETAVADGHFPARWMPDANYGYGYPFYNFYAPLSIYITLLFRFIGFSYVQAIEFSQLAGFMVAAAGMFALGRRWFKSEWAGLLTAVAYTFAPFHMVNVYVRGDSLAEFWAMAFYPLVLLAADALAGSSRGRVAAFAIAYAALILSHNISALIFSPFLFLYIFLRWFVAARLPGPVTLRSTARTGLQIAGGFLLAFGLSAWFFVPALAEKGLAQLGPVTEGYFHFSNHFLGLADQPLLQRSVLFDYHVDGREAFRMGLIQTLTMLVGLFLLLIPIKWRPIAAARLQITRDRRLFIVLTLLISTVMLLPLSRPLWEHLPLLSFTQFPWRFLSIQAFAGALAVGVVGLLPGRKVIVPVAAVLFMVAALGNLQTDHLLLTDADVTAARLAHYEWFTGNIGTTISAEYLPTTVQPRMMTSGWLNHADRWSVQALTGEIMAATLQTSKTGRQVWQVETAVPATLIFPTMYWPGWQAWVEGERVEARPSPGSGLIMLDLPVGQQSVELRLMRTPVRLLAELVSAATLLLVLGLFVTRTIRIGSKGGMARYTLLAGLSLILLILVARLWPEPEVTDDNLTWDFVQMAYLHHELQGVDYTNGVVFQDYAYSTDVVSAGDTLTIQSNWEQADGTPVTLRLVTPAANRVFDPSPPVLAEQTQVIENGKVAFDLPIPLNAPPGLMVPQLVLADGRPLTPSGQERGDLFLRPLRLQNPVVAEGDQYSLDVQAVRVQPRSEEVLDIQLAWITTTPLSNNYNTALRLTDAKGQYLQLADRQPGYGFQPSSLWPAGEWVNDWLALTLPPGEHEYPYVLMVQLYDVSMPDQPVLIRRLGELWPTDDGWLEFQPNEPVFELPESMEPVTAVFGDNIQLHGYTLTQTQTALYLTPVWRLAQPEPTNYTRFVHLIPLGENQPPVGQDDNMPRYGTYPTSQWLAGEVVDDPVLIPLTDISPGQYQLAVGFYTRLADGSLPRLTAVDGNGSPLVDDRFILPEIITVP